MTTSKIGGQILCPLTFTATNNYYNNLLTLKLHLLDTPKNSISLAPEVCLTGFDYDNLEEMLKFALFATKDLLEESKERTLMLTMIEKRGDEIWNVFKVFSDQKLIYERPKAKLFHFGKEDKYMSEASVEDVDFFEIDGIKCGVLICFELRFKELWQKLEGADILFVPAWWGAQRKEHLLTLTKALAIINQCYVVVSDAKNEECTQISGVIKPNGIAVYNEDNHPLVVQYEKKEIALMRRYMDVGIG
ncbi:MAG: nitrilase-related carbon-nitrogen hydrolase [Sulfurimonadaceae bacterium]|jgi:predicted amidohydrolase|nr:nitrilase-related carbon-nitrogen hydrolase [Sulfurimonadaceae bacterium]